MTEYTTRKKESRAHGKKKHTTTTTSTEINETLGKRVLGKVT